MGSVLSGIQLVYFWYDGLVACPGLSATGYSVTTLVVRLGFLLGASDVLCVGNMFYCNTNRAVTVVVLGF